MYPLTARAPTNPVQHVYGRPALARYVIVGVFCIYGRQVSVLLNRPSYCSQLPALEACFASSSGVFVRS
jgi:hypothetical protein